MGDAHDNPSNCHGLLRIGPSELVRERAGLRVCSGNQLFTPDVKPGRSNLKLTACAPLFFHSYRIRDAGPCTLPCLVRSIGVKRGRCAVLLMINLFELRDTL